MKVLAYHSIGENVVKETGAELYCVSLDNFKTQMEIVSQLIGHSSSLVAEKGEIHGQDKNPKDSELSAKNQELILTFDDGDITNYKFAYPVLKELQLKAYFFIVVGRVGSSGYMNWDQIKELKNNGMVIGSHGMTHTFLTELKDNDLTLELEESKRILQDVLACPIDSLSIPRGFCNAHILKKAKELGYTTIYTSDNRIAVKADWDSYYFKKVLLEGYSLLDNAGLFIANALKSILGPVRYDRVRTAILKVHGL